VPFIIGLAGSVAVGKSTTARVLQALLSRWPSHPSVALVTTDGFLFRTPCSRAGAHAPQGLPRELRPRRLVRFLADVKAAPPRCSAPSTPTSATTSSRRVQAVRHPDIVIVEGLNVLQAPPAGADESQLFASDFFDYSIYVDAHEQDIRDWYIERFLRLRDTVFQDPQSYFHRYAGLDEPRRAPPPTDIWANINGVNLRENILPTRMRAHLILRKGAQHRVEQVHPRGPGTISPRKNVTSSCAR
jgi:type I pantothenate kinase